MEDEDLAYASSDSVKALLREDIDAFGVDALQDRIAHLKAEIERCETAIKARQASRSAAEAFFKN